MSNPFFSICIPVYNSSDLCKQAIESALNQKYDDYEIIIVDDASTDNTPQIIKGYEKNPKVKVYYNEKNSGMTYNWNKCLQLAKGVYIAFVHHDDVLKDDFLINAKKIITQYSNLGIIAFLNQHKFKRPLMGLINSNDYFKYIFSMVNVPAPTETVFVRVDGMEYDLNLKYGPEMDIYMKIAQKGYDAYHSEIVNCHRNPSKWQGSVTSGSHFSFTKYADYFYIIQKYKNSNLIDYDLLRKTVDHISTQVYKRYARGIVFGIAGIENLRENFKRIVSENNYFGLNQFDRLILSIRLRISFAIKFITSFFARTLLRMKK